MGILVFPVRCSMKTKHRSEREQGIIFLQAVCVAGRIRRTLRQKLPMNECSIDMNACAMYLHIRNDVETTELEVFVDKTVRFPSHHAERFFRLFLVNYPALLGQ